MLMPHVNRKQLVYFLKLILVFLFSTFSSFVYCNPQNGTIVAGDAAIAQAPNSTVITQQSQRAIIDWSTFNIGEQEKTSFLQPAGGITLNRINPNLGASQIFGQLNATGQIILINQAGIFFGPTAQVNVGSIIASTTDISNNNFLNGHYTFDQTSTIFDGSVVNQGTLIAASHGLIALLGNSVSNTGMIQANLGNIILASGTTFTLDLTGDGLVNFSVPEGTTQPGQDINGTPLSYRVNNSGSLLANGGTILLTAKSAQSVIDNVINMSGVAVAQSVDQQNGDIILLGQDQTAVNLSGTIDASGLEKNNTGGTVSITAPTVYSDAPLTINVSGDVGGGNIFLGGNFHGSGPLANANYTLLSSQTNLLADAISSGNGGNIAVWSDILTQFLGTINSQGGALSGNGGYIETSGKENLSVGSAHVNLSAPHGQMGTWLLDPSNVTICDSCTTLFDSLNSNTYTPNLLAGLLNATLSSGDLGTSLNSANITVVTTNVLALAAGNITVSGANGLAANWNSGSNTTLTLQADNNIIINAPITLTGTGKTISLVAQGSIALNSTMDGSFTLSGSAANSSVTVSAALGGTTPLTAVNFSADTISLTSSIKTTGGQSYTATSGAANAISLGGGIFTTTGGSFQTTGATQFSSGTTITTNGGNIGFGAITDATANTDNLTLNAGAGNVSFNSTVDGLNNLVINSTGITTFSAAVGGTIALTSITTDAGGSNTIDGNITTTGAQLFNDNVSLGNNTQFSGTSIIINGTLAGNGKSVTFVNTDANSTVTGTISNIASLTKNGTGTFTLSGANTYTTSNAINAGTLVAANNSALGNATSTTVANAATLNINGVTLGADNVTLNGTGVGSNGALTAAGTASLAGNINLATASSIGNTGSLTLSGVISGTAALTKIGSGTLILSGTNKYTGSTSVNAGTLSLANASALGVTTNAVTVNGSSVLNINNVTLNANPITLNSNNSSAFTGTGTAGALGTVTLDTNTSIGGTGTLTLSGVISGGFQLTKTDSGTLILAAANTYTDNTLVNVGLLSITNAAGLGPTSNLTTVANGATLDLDNVAVGAMNITLNGTGVSDGALTGTGTSSLSGNITLATDSAIGGTGTLTLSGLISGTANLSKVGTGAVILSKANTYVGNTTINAGTLQVGINNALPTATFVLLANTAGTIFNLNNFNQSIAALSGGGTMGGNISLGSGTLTIAQNTNGTYAGVISGTGGLTLAGSNTLTLSGTNTYSGATAINSGTLQLDAVNAIAHSGAMTLANTAGATLDLNGFNNAIDTLSGGGTTGGNITLGSGTLTVNQAADGTYAGIISGTGGLTKAGSGTVVLSGANTYSGNTQVNAGTLLVSNDNGLGIAGSNTQVAAGATLALSNVNINNETVQLNGVGVSSGGALRGIGTSTFNGHVDLVSTSNIGVAGNGVLTLGGGIGGAGGYTKVDTGTLIILGPSTYNGQTAVANGTLSLDAANAIPTTSGLSLANNTTVNLNGIAQTIGGLSGSGTMNLGSGTLTIDQNADTIFSGTLNGSGGLTTIGTGTLTLSGANTYTGDTTINAGVLVAANANALGGSPTAHITVADGATLQVDNIYLATEPLTLNGIGVNGEGALFGTGISRLDGNIDFATNANVGVGGTGVLTLGGRLSGSGQLTKVGTGTLIILFPNNANVPGDSSSFGPNPDTNSGGNSGSSSTDNNVTNVMNSVNTDPTNPTTSIPPDITIPQNPPVSPITVDSSSAPSTLADHAANPLGDALNSLFSSADLLSRNVASNGSNNHLLNPLLASLNSAALTTASSAAAHFEKADTASTQLPSMPSDDSDMLTAILALSMDLPRAPFLPGSAAEIIFFNARVADSTNGGEFGPNLTLAMYNNNRPTRLVKDKQIFSRGSDSNRMV